MAFANLGKLSVAITADSRGLQKSLDSAKGKVSGFSSDILAATGVTFAFAASIAHAAQTNANFEQSIADLSAITGVTGKQLDSLKKTAIEFGETTTQSATNSAKALQIVASAKPELIETAGALALVTKEALTLAEAAGIEIPEAADAMANSLNLFGAEADQANRFISLCTE